MRTFLLIDFKSNGLEDVILVLRSRIEDVVLGFSVDIIVSEYLYNFLFHILFSLSKLNTLII